MAASQLSARKVVWSTSALTGVDISTGTLVGQLSQDSEIPAPEGEYDDFMLGPAEVLARVALNLRFAGTGSGILSTLQTAKNANPPTEGYLYVVNRSGTAYTRYGPLTISQAYLEGDKTNPQRQSFRIRATATNDTAEEVMLRVTGTIVLPS